MTNTIGKQITKLRNRFGYTQENLAEIIGVSKQTISNWETGLKVPRMGAIQKLADHFNVTKSFIIDGKEESNILSIYEKLESPRQQIVYDTAKQQLHEQETTIEEKKICYLPTIDNSPVAANPTQLTYGDVSIEDQAFVDVPTGADFAVLIHGNSMEPLIEDGSYIFVKKQNHIENGEIALVEIDGDGVTCKKIFFNPHDGSIILHSLNAEYDDRELDPEHVRIVGKVLI